MANAFSNFLSKEKQGAEDNFNNNQTERYQPKNKTIRLSKKAPEVFVRILPGVKTQEDPDGVKFSSKFRSVFLNYIKGDGSATSSPFVLPFDFETSVLDRFVNDWKNNNVNFNDFKSRPAKRYLVNVIPLVSNGGQFQYALDQTGNIFVAPMELTKTLYDDLIVKLQDEHLMPTQDSNLNFISENHAFAVKLFRTGQGKDTEYKSEVYQRQDLGDLPQGWENLASDINEMAKSTEEQAPGFVNFVINSINGTDKSVKNFEFEDDGNTAPKNSEPQVQAPTQAQIDNQVPTNFGGQEYSAPVQPQQPGNQVQQQQQQAPQQNNVDWNNLAQQQSQPEQPQQSVQPQQQPNPFANFDTNAIDDSQVPFNTGNKQAPQAQPQQQQQQAQPQQQAPQEPQQEQQNIPQKQQQEAKPQSVDDILGNIGL